MSFNQSGFPANSGFIAITSPAVCVSTGLLTTANDHHVIVYPNPAVDFPKIAISDAYVSDNLRFLLYDCRGTLLRSVKIEHADSIINRSLEADGLYFYRIVASQKQISSGKFMFISN